MVGSATSFVVLLGLGRAASGEPSTESLAPFIVTQP